jgi:uncharacterized protein (DUF1330 family)
MAAFLIADVKVRDLEGYRSSGYLDAAMASAAKFGGSYIARGGETAVFEGEWEPNRLVIIQFPDMDSLKAWYASDEYTPWIEVRRSLTESNLVGLEGI